MTKLLATVLLIALVLACLPQTVTKEVMAAATQEDWLNTSSGVFAAHLDALQSAIIRYGIVDLNESADGTNLSRGVQYARLIDFDNDGVPELLYVYSNGGEVFVRVYRYSGGIAQHLLSADLGRGNFVSNFYIATGRSGNRYLIDIFAGSGSGRANFYTIRNGEAVTVLTKSSYRDWDFSAGAYYTIHYNINERRVSLYEYLAAAETLLGISLNFSNRHPNPNSENYGQNLLNNPSAVIALHDFLENATMSTTVPYLASANPTTASVWAYESTNQTSEHGLIPQNLQTNLRLQIGNTTYILNGTHRQSEVAPFIADERTMVPLRLVAEALGAEVGWNDATRTVTINRDGVNLSLVLDRPLPNNMGTPTSVDGRTFVPVAYVSEMLGATIRWDEVTRAVYIVSGAKEAVVPMVILPAQASTARPESPTPIPISDYGLMVAENFLSRYLSVFSDEIIELRFDDYSNYRFYNPITNTRIENAQLPYFTGNKYASMFELYDLDNDGIPEIFITFTFPHGSMGKQDETHMYRYFNGTFLRVQINHAIADSYGNIGHYQSYYWDRHGNIIVAGDRATGLFSREGLTVMVYVEFDGNVLEITEIIMEFYGDYEDSSHYINHLLNERIPYRAGDLSRYLTHIPGMPNESLTLIPRLIDAENSLRETITQRLRAEGRIP